MYSFSAQSLTDDDSKYFSSKVWDLRFYNEEKTTLFETSTCFSAQAYKQFDEFLFKSLASQDPCFSKIFYYVGWKVFVNIFVSSYLASSMS